MADPFLTDAAIMGSSAEASDIQRQRKLAELLTANSFNQPQGQMISGHYVAPSWTQQLVPLANALGGSHLGSTIDKKQEAYAKLLRGQESEAYTQFQDLMANPETRPQAMKLAASNQFLQPMYKELMKPQKLTAEENLVIPNIGGSGPINLASGGVKLGQELKDAAREAGLDPTKSDTWSPQDWAKARQIEAQVIAFKRPVTNVSVNTGQHGFDNTIKLGEKFTSEPIYKAHQEVSQAYKQVFNALDRGDAAGDLAAAIKINKMFDPTGVVKESEAARIAAARGNLQTLMQYTAKITKGETLDATQRKQYKALVKDFYDISGEQYNETRAKYSEIGKQNQLSGVETMLGQPWKPTAPEVNKALTPNMQNANKILGIPSGTGK